MVPAMVAIAEDVLDLAPKALFFNYGNPMAPVCRAVRKATGAEMVGLCHGVFHMATSLSALLGVPEERFAYTAVGMNHLTWFVEVRVDGVDAMPRLKEIARAKLAEVAEGRAAPEEATPFAWELLSLFGAFPAPIDRHITEFFPQLWGSGAYYGKRLGVDAYSLEGTIAHGDETYARMRQDALSDAPLPESYFRRSSGEHEQVLEIIASIRHDRKRIYSVNLPNRGQVPNLPGEAIIEGPAVVDGGGLRAITQRPLPAGVVGTLATRMAWVETVVEAALEGSRDKFVQALLLDGAVGSLDTARALADDLLAAQAKYLPQFRLTS